MMLLLFLLLINKKAVPLHVRYIHCSISFNSSFIINLAIILKRVKKN